MDRRLEDLTKTEESDHQFEYEIDFDYTQTGSPAKAIIKCSRN